MSEFHESAIRVVPGLEQPAPVTDRPLPRRRREFSPAELAEGVIAHDRVAIGRALSLMESIAPRHSDARRELLALLQPRTGNSYRLGISGVPGVGKSTFIEALGMHAITAGARVAVLAVDPSSEVTGGSILGDKTRMNRLAADPHAIIRPSASGAWLGGVARATRESILVCEAAGFGLIVIETVGVGQSETQVASMVDFFLLLMLAGAGDELQGIKRGILEIADAVVINKADGDNLHSARRAQAQLMGALHLLRPEDEASRRISLASALTGSGIAEIWDMIRSERDRSATDGSRDERRRQQTVFWMNQTIEHLLRERFAESPKVLCSRNSIEAEVQAGVLSPFDAARKLVELAFDSENKSSPRDGKG